MKNNKGITLATLVMYCVIMVILVGVIVSVRANTDDEIKEIEQEITYIPELNTLSMYMLQETKNAENSIKTIAADGSYVEFASGNKYAYSDGNIFKINEQQNIRICENITSCEFSDIRENNTDILQVYIDLGGETPITKVMKYTMSEY